MVLDMICLQLAFILAYALRGKGMNLYGDILYRNMAIFLGLADLVVIFTAGTMKSVLKRGHYKEFVATLKQSIIVGVLAIIYLFMIQEGQSFSRMILITTVIIYLLLSYGTREIWKNSLHKKMENGGDKKLLIVTSKDEAAKVVRNMQENNYARYSIAGVVVIDDNCVGQEICGIPVVAKESDVSMYVCQEWIDEVLVVVSEHLPYPNDLIDRLTETGVTVHLNLAKITNKTGKRQFVEKVGNYTVLTTSLNYASFGQLFLKRLMDICGGLAGCIFTGIITIFVGPAIYLASPGPIFFSQERVGKNGKKFKMYKFRSMYMDAEERKAELMKENKLGDGKMFKMDFDPRVIGNKVLPDGTHKTGVGDFIRRTSLDEFPQFFNVLKGDMSIVGTRPPLISETNLYEPHHKVRLAIKPGITGMWQVSGRSDITDFEGLHGKMADAVVIIATDETGEKILIDKEFRLAPGEWVYNFPAGLIDPGETPQESAKRELREETGLELYEIDDFIGTSYSAVGFSNETNVCVVGKARGEFHKSTSTLEEIEAGWYTKAEVRELLKKAKFAARTQAYCYVWSRE